MDAFDMISEPVVFAQELREHAVRVHRSVELIQSLTDALLAEQYEKVWALYEQMAAVREEVNRSKLSLYGQIEKMHFHAAGGCTFNEYLDCQDQMAYASQDFAELLASRKTIVPTELRDDFQALVAQVVSVSKRMTSLAERLFSEGETACTDADTQNALDAIQEIVHDSGRARQREMEFVRHLYSLEKQIDPVTLVVLDKYRAALHEVADSTERAADHLRRMMR